VLNTPIATNHAVDDLVNELTDNITSSRKGGRVPLVALVKQYQASVPPVLNFTTDRLAHFLDYAARHAPYTHIPFQYIAQALDGLHRTPLATADRTLQLARASTSSGFKEKLFKTHRRATHYKRGLGVRASVDEKDLLDTEYLPSLDRLAAAARQANKRGSRIDASKLPPQARKFLADSLQAVNKLDLRELVAPTAFMTELRKMLQPKT